MHILFDCERMKYQNIGLFHYSWNLGNALKDLLESTNDRISFYYPHNLHAKLFGTEANYVPQHPYHKLLFPKTNKFDIWHCSSQASSYSPRGSKIKKVLTIHDLNFLHEPHTSKHKIERRLKGVQSAIALSDAIICISEFVKNEVEEKLQLKNKKVKVIHNGCQLFPNHQAQKPTYAPQGTFLFTIGTVLPKKNFHVIPALLLNNEHTLVISGIINSPSYYNEIMSEATRHGVEKRVHFTGPVNENDKQWLYANCEAFVFPSLAEGFGLPVLEAMSFGKPTFLSNLTSLPEIGGNEAFYFNSFDPKEMQKVFIDGMNKYNSNKSAYSQAYINRTELFSWENCAKQCTSLYRSLLSI